MAIEKWRPNFQNQQFVIRMDQKTLHYLSDQRLSTGIQHKAFLKLMVLNYIIQYKCGITNDVVDALSRRTHDASILAISVTVPKWLENLVVGYCGDTHSSQLLAELTVTGSSEHGYIPWNKVFSNTRVEFGWALTHWPNNTSCRACMTVPLEATRESWQLTSILNACLHGPS